MEQKVNEVSINGVDYVRKDSVSDKAVNLDGMPYCIIRGSRSGVFAGYVKGEDGQRVELIRSRRLWYWDGAASLSQLAVEGVSKPGNCKFPCEMPEHTVIDAIEIISCTKVGQESIAGVPVWKK